MILCHINTSIILTNSAGLYDSQDPNITLTITGCVFGWNSVEGEGEGFGGAVVATGGVVNVHNTVFQDNRGEYRVET